MKNLSLLFLCCIFACNFSYAQRGKTTKAPSKYEKKEIGGYIAHFNMQKWWFESFSKKEREYIANSYRPDVSGNRLGELQELRNNPKNRVKTLVENGGKIKGVGACEFLRGMYHHIIAADESQFKVQSYAKQRGCKLENF